VTNFKLSPRQIFVIAGILISVSGLYFYMSREKAAGIRVYSPANPDRAGPTAALTEVLPVAGFEERITKKPFGLFITPETSPVQPERFSGYHTGVDVEYEDTEGEVPVLAVCDGEIVSAKWVSGYGGTMVLKCDDDRRGLFFIYGHLDPDSFISQAEVKNGDQIGVLGEGQTRATDFERKHLHFAIKSEELDLRGYVNNKSDLGGWLDPEKFF
jgi:murein DD-endopeptidase MepM/ murein hydrolase activator NlpD